ncbi:flocculation protein FLO11-like [Hibiscus syriacus]|uniref:Flocculation protein FLO11-like n=1 Tax=Hibiscus syriacus TaxID=106335 RepID=A0A6A2XPC1_HIBSY|nr:flocculation protein FLO11-like [Hibiscus syriacus]
MANGRIVRDGVAAHASICQRSSSTNVMETDCREHVVAELDCCAAFDVNAHSAPNMGFEGLKNMETAAFDVNAYSTANLCLDGQHGLKNMESDVINITLEELITKISRKIHVESSRRVSSLQYRFPTSLLPLTYTSFELSNNDDVQMMVEAQSNYSDDSIEMSTNNPYDNIASSSRGRYSSANPFDLNMEMSSTQPSVQFPFDAIASSSRGRHSTVSFFDLNVDMPSISRGRRASSRFYDLNVESMKESSSLPEEPLREPGADGNVAQTDPPAHMYEVDYGAMYGPEFADMPHLGDYGYYSSINNGELSLGMEFSSKEEAMMAIKNYNIRNSVQSRVDCSTTEKYLYNCSMGTLSPIKKLGWQNKMPLSNFMANGMHLTTNFQSYPQCVNAVKYCKPVVQIDETFLYGKYKQVLLLAVVQDGNRNILPVAFALVEGEHTASWAFFLRNLRAHVITRENICVISDRGAGIKAAMESLGPMWQPPFVQHRYCLRHIAANYHGRYKKNDERQLIVRMGK